MSTEDAMLFMLGRKISACLAARLCSTFRPSKEQIRMVAKQFNVTQRAAVKALGIFNYGGVKETTL